MQNIDANGDNTKIVRAITELARGLGISIIAEGAETEAELDCAAVDRLRPGARLFDRLPDARRASLGLAHDPCQKRAPAAVDEGRQQRLSGARGRTCCSRRPAGL